MEVTEYCVFEGHEILTRALCRREEGRGRVKTAGLSRREKLERAGVKIDEAEL